MKFVDLMLWFIDKACTNPFLEWTVVWHTYCEYDVKVCDREWHRKQGNYNFQRALISIRDKIKQECCKHVLLHMYPIKLAMYNKLQCKRAKAPLQNEPRPTFLDHR